MPRYHVCSNPPRLHEPHDKPRIFSYDSSMRESWSRAKNEIFVNILLNPIAGTCIANMIEQFVENCERHVIRRQIVMDKHNPLPDSIALYHGEFLRLFYELSNQRNDLSFDEKSVFDSYLDYVLEVNRVLEKYHTLFLRHELDYKSRQAQIEIKRKMTETEYQEFMQEEEEKWVKICSITPEVKPIW